MRDQKSRRSLWSSAILVRRGELSFAFYLTHILVMRTAQAVPQAEPGAGSGLACAVFCVSIGLSCALNEFIERPARQYLLRAAR
jgi:peptidoglycan/LPS O-acetylase OafA/YrhL